jgi:predicted small lipoprotein YifL
MCRVSFAMNFRFAPLCLAGLLLSGCGLRGNLIVPPASSPPLLERAFNRAPPQKTPPQAGNAPTNAGAAAGEAAKAPAPAAIDPEPAPALKPSTTLSEPIEENNEEAAP